MECRFSAETVMNVSGKNCCEKQKSACHSHGENGKRLIG